MTRAKRDPRARFEAFVHYEPNTGCWLWSGATVFGYGRFNSEGRSVLAHRWNWENTVGTVPAGLELDHLCRVRACVNPAHLEPVTGFENWRRGESPAAKYSRRTRCHMGHELSPDNLSKHGGSGRKCKTCHAKRERDRYREKVSCQKRI